MYIRNVINDREDKSGQTFEKEFEINLKEDHFLFIYDIGHHVLAITPSGISCIAHSCKKESPSIIRQGA